MGVSFPAITFRAPSQRHRDAQSANGAAGGATGGSRKYKKPKKKIGPAATMAAERRRRWWSLCKDDDSSPASLGDFLEVERRFGDGAFYGTAAELEGVVVSQPNNGRVLFADGRVLPPAEIDEGTSSPGEALCRFPILLTGICSSGGPR